MTCSFLHSHIKYIPIRGGGAYFVGTTSISKPRDNHLLPRAFTHPFHELFPGHDDSIPQLQRREPIGGRQLVCFAAGDAQHIRYHLHVEHQRQIIIRPVLAFFHAAPPSHTHAHSPSLFILIVIIFAVVTGVFFIVILVGFFIVIEFLFLFCR